MTISIDTPGVTSFSYTYDANKNKLTETIGGAMAPYSFNAGTTYDQEDRLTAWSRADGNLSQAWALSLVGNHLTTTTNGLPQTRTHTPVHEIATISGLPDPTHDLKGNMTFNPLRGGQTYAWDFDNKLSTATTTSGVHTYTYDALGRRVSKATGGATTVYISAGNQEIAEYSLGSPPASPLRQYAYGTYIDEPLVLISASAKHYYHCNNLYSIAALTNSLGAPAERYAYSAYGQTTILDPTLTPLPASALDNSYTFTARRLDPETGLHHYRARQYNSELGRFANRDPIA